MIEWDMKAEWICFPHTFHLRSLLKLSLKSVLKPGIVVTLVNTCALFYLVSVSSRSFLDLIRLGQQHASLMLASPFVDQPSIHNV